MDTVIFPLSLQLLCDGTHSGIITRSEGTINNAADHFASRLSGVALIRELYFPSEVGESS
jgi:hypothetical protein